MNFEPKKARILIVDDTLQNIQVLGTTLKKQGYQLNAAQNGKQALAQTDKTRPDLILLDIMMPEMDGFECCRRLKENHNTRDIPVVFLSAKVETDDMIKGFELGAVDYVTKPFNAVELLKRVETHLELAFLRRDLQTQVEEKTDMLLHEHEERLSAEKRLAGARKLEAVGRLAFGAAHEINSPMQSIAGNITFFGDLLEEIKTGLGHYAKLMNLAQSGQLSADELKAIEEALEESDLDYIMQEGPKALAKTKGNIERVSKIVRAMQDLAGSSEEEKVAVDLNEMIGNNVAALQGDWAESAELTLDLADDLPAVPCHPGDIGQVIVHLLTNAAQAIADTDTKGQITVRTRRDQDQAVIEVTDTGTGIPAEVRERVFDPFFTTRDVGKGMGTGLSLCHEVVTNRLGGEISFDTETGQGTTFTVRLPFTP